MYVGFSQKGNTKIRLITIYFGIFTTKLCNGTYKDEIRNVLSGVRSAPTEMIGKHCDLAGDVSPI